MLRSKRPAAKKPTKRTPAPGDAPFARVWAIVSRVPPGRVITYGSLSRLIDGRLTPVGVGWAIRAAAEDAIPWHRVVNSRGTLSTEAEQPGLQRALLEAEGVRFDRDGRLDLEALEWSPPKRRPR